MKLKLNTIILLSSCLIKLCTSDYWETDYEISLQDKDWSLQLVGDPDILISKYLLTQNKLFS